MTVNTDEILMNTVNTDEYTDEILMKYILTVGATAARRSLCDAEQGRGLCVVVEKGEEFFIWTSYKELFFYLDLIKRAFFYLDSS